MNRMVFSDGGETAMCYIENKLSAPESGSQKEGASFCTLFSATNTVIARKALRAGKWSGRSSRLRGLQIDFQLRRPELQESERTDFPRLRPLLDSALKGQSELTRVLPHRCRGHGCCCKLQSYYSKGPRKKAGQGGLNRNLSWS